MVEVKLEDATKAVAWNFSTSTEDIGFGYAVRALEDDQDGVPRLVEKSEKAVEKVKACEGSGVSGQIEVDPTWSGATLYLTFDNSQSANSKSLSYTITVRTS